VQIDTATADLDAHHSGKTGDQGRNGMLMRSGFVPATSLQRPRRRLSGAQHTHLAGVLGQLFGQSPQTQRAWIKQRGRHMGAFSVMRTTDPVLLSGHYSL